MSCRELNTLRIYQLGGLQDSRTPTQITSSSLHLLDVVAVAWIGPANEAFATRVTPTASRLLHTDWGFRGAVRDNLGFVAVYTDQVASQVMLAAE